MNVLSLLAEGKTIPSVALLTKKTYKTVDSHFYHLAKKCDIPPVIGIELELCT
ncbi:MAG TPA: hypothetical protein IGR89_07805 [Oscillatoriaceae cyanobacterium M7585_C2015_266]|nr:hypothetical protein [Oscillatoriaceae cyanobacterium M7585_C2015_266]